jgi:hypothetical protein
MPVLNWPRTRRRPRSLQTWLAERSARGVCGRRTGEGVGGLLRCLFEDVDVIPCPPERNRGAYAADPAADNRNCDPRLRGVGGSHGRS